MIRDDLFGVGLDLRALMFGPASVEGLENTPKLTEKAQEVITRVCFGDIWQRDGLDRKTRSLITVAMLVALGRGHELRAHLTGALANGVTEVEIRELMLHSFLYCGLPAAMEGFRAAEEVLAHQKEATGV